MKINKCKLVIDVIDLMDVFHDMKITVSDVSGDTKPYIHSRWKDMIETQSIYMGKNLTEFSRFILHFLVSFVPKLLSDLVRGLKRNKLQFDGFVFLVNNHKLSGNICK